MDKPKRLPVMVSNIGYLDSLYIYNVVSSNTSFTFEPNSFPLILAPGQTQIFNISYSRNYGWNSSRFNFICS